MSFFSSLQKLLGNVFSVGWKDLSERFDNEPFGVLAWHGNAVAVAIFKKNRQQQPILIGFGVAPCHSITNGFITDMKDSRRAIDQALAAAENIAQYSVKNLMVIFSGPKPAVVIKKHRLNLDGERITPNHLQHLNQKFWSPKIMGNNRLLYPLVYGYQLDESPMIANPLDLEGDQLTLTMAMIYQNQHGLENMERALNNLRPSLIIDRAMSAVLGMASLDEQKLGVLSIHIGKDTTDIAIIKNHCPVFLDRLLVGDDNLTIALAQEMRVEKQVAETIKKSLPDITNLALDGWSPSPFLKSINKDQAVSIARRHVEKLLHDIDLLLRQKKINKKALFAITLSGQGSHIKGFATIMTSYFDQYIRTKPYRPLINPPNNINANMNARMADNSDNMGNNIGREISGTEIAKTKMIDMIPMVGAAMFYIKKQHQQKQKNTFIAQSSKLNQFINWLKRNYLNT